MNSGPRVRAGGVKNRGLAMAASVLLTPAALMAFALACWRLAADLRFAGSFPITEGLFSHWLVWFAVAALLEGLGIYLHRYGAAPPRRPGPASSGEL